MQNHVRALTQTLIVIATLGASMTAAADCDYREPRSAEVDAAGATKIVIEARSGDLKVLGSTTPRVRVKGEACAPTKAALSHIKIEARRDGDTVIVKAVLPEERLSFEGGSLDLIVDIPANLPVKITDSSGDTDIAHVGALELEDSSGDATIQDASGDVSVTDSSGDIRIVSVRGNVAVRDSSGDVTLEDIGGNVAIPIDSSGSLSIRRVHGGVHITNDSSGDISIAAVDKDVAIDNDSSGDIRIVDVGGNFTVANDSTGDIEHRNVLGAVKVPSRR